MSAIQPWQGTDEINIANLNTKNVIIGNLNQSIDGIKTFENFPLSLSLYPTSPFHFATKAYVDLIGGGGGSIVTQLPDLTDVDDTSFVYTQYNLLSANFSDSKFYSRTADQANLVDKSSAQTLTGKKTFDISTPANWPIVSNAATDPPSDGAFATKKYVDDLAGGGAYVTLATTQTITGLKTFNNQYLVQSLESESNYPYFTLSRSRTAGADLQVSDVVGEIRFNGQIAGSSQEVAGFMALASGTSSIDSSVVYLNMFHGTEPQLARFSFESAGYFETYLGIKVFNNNTSGKILQGNGTAYIPVTLDAADIATKSTDQTISGNKSFSGTLENISTGTTIFAIKSSGVFLSGTTIGMITFRDRYIDPYETRAFISVYDYLDGSLRCGKFSITCTVNGVAVGGDEFIFDHNVHFDCKGYKISGAAPSGNLLIGNGTVFTSSTPDSGGIVTKSGSQTIDGVKTFLATAWPVINNAAAEPTSDGAFATKKYVDDNISSAGATQLSELTDVTGTMSYTNYNVLSANGSSFITRTLDAANIIDKTSEGQTISGQKVFTTSNFTEFRGNIYISKAASGALPAGTVAGIFDVFGVDDGGYIMEFGGFSSIIVNSSHASPRSKVRMYVSASTTPNFYEFNEDGYFIAPIGFKTGLSSPPAGNILCSTTGLGFVSASREAAQIVTTETTQEIWGTKTLISNSYPNIYLKNNNNGIPLSSGIMGTIRFIDNSTYSPIVFARKSQGLCFSTTSYFNTSAPFWMDQNGYFSCNGIKLWTGVVTDPPMPPNNTAGLILHCNGIAFVGNTPDGANIVDKSSNQTIGGVKTFSSIPHLPASDPISSNEAVRKAYVDALIGSGGASSLGELSDVNDFLSYTNYNVLQANGALFVSRSLDAANIVDKSSSQEITGTKNFSTSIPYLPNFNPTENNHAVRKFYVDQLIAGVGGGVTTLPQLTDVTDSISYVNNNVLSANGSQFTSRTPDSANLVDKSSTQTIAGVKTFSSIPFIPLTDPTSLQHVANKNYVDTKFSSITGSYVTTNTDQTITGTKTFESQNINHKLIGTLSPLYNFMRSWTGESDLPINSALGAIAFYGRLNGGYWPFVYNYSMLVSTVSGGTGRFFIALTNNGALDFETFVFYADGTAVAKNSWTTFTGSHLYQSVRDDLEINSAVILKDDGTIDYTNIENDRRFIGIIVLKKDSNDLYNREGEKIKDSMGNEIEVNNTVYVVAAVGDCLTENNSGVKIVGNIENGDSLCTSSIEGCLMKHAEDLDFISFIEGRAMIARQTIEDKTATEESVIYATFVN